VRAVRDPVRVAVLCFRQQADKRSAGQKSNTAMEGGGDTEAGAVL